MCCGTVAKTYLCDTWRQNMDPWEIALNVLVKVNFLFLSKLDLIVLPCPSHHSQKNVDVVVASHCIAQHSRRAVVSRLEVILWRMLKNLLFCMMDSTVRQTVKSGDILILSTVVQVVISKCHWHISCSHSSWVGCKNVAGDCVRSYQSGKCHKVKCFKIEYFQEGVQNLLCVSSPTTTFYMPSDNNLLVIMLKQKAKEKFCVSAILFYIPQ